MNVVVSFDIAKFCIHNYLCICVNLCKHLKNIRSLRKFVHRYLIVHSITPVNIFKNSQYCAIHSKT